MDISKIATMLFLFSLSTGALSFSKTEILQAKEEIVKLSVMGQASNCPCPYSLKRNGLACGKRSAYGGPTGRGPSCFVEDISNAEAIHYLKRQRTSH
jgi:hypothetical protein